MSDTHSAMEAPYLAVSAPTTPAPVPVSTASEGSLRAVAHSDASRSGVSMTARVVCGMRALEADKGDAALVVDPFARQLAQDEGMAWLRSISDERREYMVDLLAVRTRAIDDILADAVACGPRQLVILGAGLDTRAHRLRCLAGVAVFEVDFADVFVVKSPLLAGTPPLADLHVVAADLCLATWPDRLTAAGFDASQPTVWLMEGLTGYLKEPEVAHMFRSVRALSAAGSRAVVTFVGAGGFMFGPGAPKADFHSFCTDDGDALLRDCGWSNVVQRRIGHYTKLYGRSARVTDDVKYFLTCAEAV